MPIYEFQCEECGAVQEVLWRSDSNEDSLCCKACDSNKVVKVMSSPSIHRNLSSQLNRLDNKYDKMVDQAVRNTPEADPNRHLKKMKPFRNPRPLSDN